MLILSSSGCDDQKRLPGAKGHAVGRGTIIRRTREEYERTACAVPPLVEFSHRVASRLSVQLIGSAAAKIPTLTRLAPSE